MRYFLFLIISFFAYSAFTMPAYAESSDFEEQYTQDIANNKKRLYVVHFGLDPNKAVATLFVGPNGKMVLFDLGRKKADVIKIIEKIQHVNTAQGRDEDLLDYLIVSHEHSDHNGNNENGTDKNCTDSPDNAFCYLKSHLDIGDTNDSQIYRYNTITDLVSLGDYISLGKVGRHKAKLNLIAANREIHGQDTPANNDSNPNTKSIVMLLTWKNFVYYIGGDLHGGGPKAGDCLKALDFDLNSTSSPDTSVNPFSANSYCETDNLETPVAQAVHSMVGNAVDVVQINHHGSSTSSFAESLDILMPADYKYRNAIINVSSGYGNLPVGYTVQTILNHIYTKTADTLGYTHLWQTYDGGTSYDGGSKHNIEDSDVWIRTSGNKYSIRSAREETHDGGKDGHIHSYKAIKIRRHRVEPANTNIVN